MLRIMPRLDIKAPNLVKGIRLEGLRVLGSPAEFASQYFEDGADEIIYQDIVASLYERNSLSDLVTQTSEKLFVPLTVGGGLRSIDDIQLILRAGADKVCINTAAIARPGFITEAAEKFGTQCIVVAIETIRQRDGSWKAFTDNGREHSNLDAVKWAHEAVEMGAGELFLTSVDREGTQKGFDCDFIKLLAKEVKVPVVAHGGAGSLEHIKEVAQLGVDGISLAYLLHYKKITISEIKDFLLEGGVEVRP